MNDSTGRDSKNTIVEQAETCWPHKPDIGDKINTQIIAPLIAANERLARSDLPDFNDPSKLGEGQAMVDRLTTTFSAMPTNT